MNHTFYKYQGTGNDFVLIDNRKKNFDINNTKRIAHLCDRRFGIGADGLILLENSEEVDFKMVYFNSDGNQSTMCGNGGRCIVSFAKFLNVISTETTFEAIDGLHYAKIDKDIVHLQMIDVCEIENQKKFSFLDTGSPHHVQIVENVKDFNVVREGCSIRNSSLYEKQGGSNINFVTQLNEDSFQLRTYERGVEDETLSCGTGATATAIAMFDNGFTKSTEINLNVEGGQLKVTFDKKDNSYTNIFLIGPAAQVFKGEIEC